MGFGVIRMCLECFQEDYGFAMLLGRIFKGYLWLRRVFLWFRRVFEVLSVCFGLLKEVLRCLEFFRGCFMVPVIV